MSTKPDKERRHMLEEVLQGLQQPQKMLPSKYLYDERGSVLFDQITHLEEYYPTRTENKIIEDNIEAISSCVGSQSVIVELGSGSSKKIRILLDHFQKVAAYIPVDISEEYLLKVVRSLKRDYPDLTIKPVCADYTKPFRIPLSEYTFDRQVVFYPGSTIGNFHPDEAAEFLRIFSGMMEPEGVLLIGVDLKKDPVVLERAYNDGKGITAAFNKNILVRLNRELEADFDVDEFAHKAFYNTGKDRIEMHLVSRKDQLVQLNGINIEFKEGESIHTENSYKYTLERFEELVKSWFRVEQVWTDEQNYFSLQYLKKR